MKRRLKNKIFNAYSKSVRLFSFDGFALLPPLIIWELSYRCNLRCKMCLFYGSGGTVPVFKDEMSVSEIEKLFRNIKQSYSFFLPRIHLTGGEPLIHKNFPKIAALLTRLGFRYSITSNFASVSDKVLDTLIKYPPSDLRISLDGPAEIHDKIRGVDGTFNLVMKNLSRLREHKLSIPVRFNCTISKDNINYLDDMLVIARKNKADLNFQHLMFLDQKHIKQHYIFCEKIFKCRPYPIGCKDRVDAGSAKIITEKIKKIKKMNSNVTFLPDLNVNEIKSYYLNLEGYIHGSYCYSVWSEARIAPNGKMYPCFDYYFGDLRVNSFNDVWNGEKARRFRKILKIKGDSFPDFPRNAVHSGTEACLTAEFEMGSGRTKPLWPSSY